MGGDSHTPHGGSIGMLCIGVGGMDVATAMTGVPMRLKMPRVIKVNLTGALKPGVNAKEVILEMLRRVTIKGGLEMYMNTQVLARQLWKFLREQLLPTWARNWALLPLFSRQMSR